MRKALKMKRIPAKEEEKGDFIFCRIIEQKVVKNYHLMAVASTYASFLFFDLLCYWQI